MIKKIFAGLFILLLVLQIVKQEANNGEVVGENHISKSLQIPEEINLILERSCNDCHSNQTNYPWYSKIQPIGFWLQNHVNEGKEELNLSEFKTYSAKKQKHKLEEIAEQVDAHEMPLFSYTLIHKQAELNQEQISLLSNWAKTEAEKIALQK
jgi:hypothetical protein